MTYNNNKVELKGKVCYEKVYFDIVCATIH